MDFLAKHMKYVAPHGAKREAPARAGAFCCGAPALLRAGIVIAATPAMTQASPPRRSEASVSPRKSDADGDADRHAQIGLRGRADRAERMDQAEIDHEGERGREHRQAEQRGERRVDGASVHGRSTTRLTGTRIAAPQSIEPAAGIIGSRPLKLRPKIAAPA